MISVRIYLFVFLLYIINVSICFSQETTIPAEKKNSFKKFTERCYFGGGFGMQFGTFTFIDISPTVMYRATEKLHVGIGGTYWYFSDNIQNYSMSIAGGRVLSRYFFHTNFFGHAEVESLNGKWDSNRKRFTIQNIFIGGGYNAPIGARSAAMIMLLYNLNDSVYSPYATNPIIRVGFFVGL